MTDKHDKLVSILTKESARARAPHHAIGIMLEALDYAENCPDGLVVGISEGFCGGLRNKLLRAIGVNPKKIYFTASWCRKEYPKGATK